MSQYFTKLPPKAVARIVEATAVAASTSFKRVTPAVTRVARASLERMAVKATGSVKQEAMKELARLKSEKK